MAREREKPQDLRNSHKSPFVVTLNITGFKERKMFAQSVCVCVPVPV